MWKKACFVLSALAATGVSLAEPLHLRCTSNDSKGGASSETWVVIDVDANSMRVNGQAYPLNMTNEAYSSVQRSGPFTMVRTIDRRTGGYKATDVYEGKPVIERIGECEKSQPPATKF